MDEKPDEVLTAATAAVGRWVREFRAAADQLNSYAIAGRWFWLRLEPNRLRVDPAEAAAWANLGYLPEEAAPLIREGLTAATVEETEQHAEQAAGGRDELLAQRIEQLVEAGEIIDPARVIRIPDPADPTREIITVRDDPDPS